MAVIIRLVRFNRKNRLSLACLLITANLVLIDVNPSFHFLLLKMVGVVGLEPTCTTYPSFMQRL